MTTVIVNKKTGAVFSDSRGTHEDYISNWKILPYPKKTTKVERHFEKVQKIYQVGSTVVTGSGSLNLLEYFVGKVKAGTSHFKGCYYIRSKFEPSTTNVLLVKRGLGDVHILQLKVSVVGLPFGWYKLKVVKNIVTKSYAILGSGGDYAIGALEMGASEVEAIKIAAKFDHYTDNGIQCNFV